MALLLVSSTGNAQFSSENSKNESYYLFPIKPGQQNSLAGTMGELRSSHFHTGIDIRTEGRVGLPVYAAADGYISRAVISSSGYGNALYILHPNGHTSVYAHLDRFEGEIADYMRKKQYDKQTFKLDLSLPKGQFKVKKGDKIADSGNSGSSGGPHLHFDIRDKNQRPLNPLSFGFDEILDRTPPIAVNVAVKTLDIESRVDGVFGQKNYRLSRIGNNYKLNSPVYALGEIGLLLDAHDKLDYSRFRCGINHIAVFVNGKETFQQHIEEFGFDQQREIYRHMSYHDLQLSGKRYQKLYIDDGNKLHFYTSNSNKGRLKIEDGKIYNIKVEMTDTYNNTSVLEFRIKGDQKRPEVTRYHGDTDFDYVLDNTMILNVPKAEAPEKITYNGEAISPAYTNSNTSTFLVDLREELPEIVEVNNEFRQFDFKDLVTPENKYTYYDENISVYFQKESLFDTLYLKTNYSFDSTLNGEIWELGSKLIPLRKSVKITLNTKNKTYDEDYRVYQLYGKNGLGFEGGKWDGNKVSFWTRTFGKYTIAKDSLAPKIVPIKMNKDDLVFKISDDLSGIKSFNCYINNRWILMNYDHKRKRIWSEKLEASIPFTGEVKLIVSDMVNNETIYTSTIN